MSLKKIAEMTDLSTATVSHALSGNRKVSKESYAKVIHAANEIGYKPNIAARMLRTQKSNTIALVIPTAEDNPMANFFYMDVLLGIRKKLWETGYNVIVSNYDFGSLSVGERSLSAVEVLKRQWVDGILFVPSSDNADQLNVLKDMGVPFVLIDRRVHGTDYSCVDSDSEQGAYDAVMLLASAGKKRIGFIGSAANFSSGANRYFGYTKALEEAGVKFNPQYVRREKRLSIEVGRRHSADLVKNGVDSIFVADNTLTIGAVLELQKNGIKVPDEIGIVGFDDFDWMNITTPPLTTIKQQSYHMGYLAAEMIMRKLNGMDINEKVKLETTVVIRKSHGVVS